MGDKYAELISKAGADYGAQRAGLREASDKRIAAIEELNRLTAEASALRSQLADFEAGIGDPLTASEFQDKAYRVQWLNGAIKAQQRIVATAQEAERMINTELAQIHGAARQQVEELLRADAAAAAAARRAQLEAALK